MARLVLLLAPLWIWPLDATAQIACQCPPDRPVYVREYFRSDGRRVRAHCRRLPARSPCFVQITPQDRARCIREQLQASAERCLTGRALGKPQFRSGDPRPSRPAPGPSRPDR
jgi:hypothetical protein